MNTLRVALFLALRYFRRASLWTTVLITFIMTLTFLNLVVVSGILVGLVEGAATRYQERYSGDILISTLPERGFIEESNSLLDALSDDPLIAAIAPRFVSFGTLEVNFGRSLTSRNISTDQVGAQVVGIDPDQEHSVTNLSTSIIEGEFLVPGDSDMIVVGANLVERLTPGSVGFDTVSDVRVGEEVRLIINDEAKDVRVKGLIKSKSGVADTKIYMLSDDLRKIIGRFDFNIDEVAVRLKNPDQALLVKQSLLAQNFGRRALIQTSAESQGQFLEDIRNTFSTLGAVIGAIALVVASITVFIVIFITAITRRKFIGILKGIGISGRSIEVSYIILSMLYAFIGVGIGLGLLYSVLIPYFIANPIDFPFSDGILAVTTGGVVQRVGLILLTTIIAGFIPARLIVRKNTLDAILGR